MKSFDDFFEQYREVWMFKIQALNAAKKLLNLDIKFNNMTSDIDQIGFEENAKIVCIFRDNNGNPLLNISFPEHILGLAMEGNVELAKLELEKIK